MKIAQDGPAVESDDLDVPVTLTITTKTELRCLWHLFNHYPDRTSYFINYDTDVAEFDRFLQLGYTSMKALAVRSQVKL